MDNPKWTTNESLRAGLNELYGLQRDLFCRLYSLQFGCNYNMLGDEQKARFVSAFGKKYKLGTLIETGTYKGDLVQNCLGDFDRIFTIELDDGMAAAAKERFKGNEKVSTLHGDSGVLLRGVLEELDGPCLLWLDAHYSGTGTAGEEHRTPIREEIRAVHLLAKPGSVILIDDASEFRPGTGYPHMEHMYDLVNGQMLGYDMDVNCNVICLTPKNQ